MNGMFMNSRGLADLAKHLHIAQCIRDHNLDFVAISETGRQDFLVSVINRISGRLDIHWYCYPPWGWSGGILLSVNSSSMNVLAASDGDFHVKFP